MINESRADRVIRGIAAVALIIIGLTVGASAPLGIVLLVVAAILAVTAAVGFCPLYGLLRIRTSRGTSH